MTWIVVTGDPIEGLKFEGPFDTERAAIDYGDAVYRDEYWVGELYPAGWMPTCIHNRDAQRLGYPARPDTPAQYDGDDNG